MAANLLPIMNAGQVAELLECSKKTVEEHARNGTIPGAKFGDGWVFSADLVIEAVKQHSLTKTNTPKPVAKSAAYPKGKSKALPQLVSF